jgi:hypothetical protein
MRTSILALFIFALSFSPVAQAQHHAFVEVQSESPEVEKGLTLSGGLSYQLPHNLSITSFLLVKGKWAKALVGTAWAPLPWLKVGASVGGSQGPDGFDFRTGYMLFLKHQQFSFLGLVDVPRQAYTGDYDGIWYDLNLMYQPLKWLVIGLKDRRPSGVGPMVRFCLDPVVLWVAWVPLSSERAEFAPEKTLFGLTFGF